MKENKYDDPAFFEQYSRMPRSREGLAAAGEWHALRRLLPDLKGKRVLDLGCGFGWHCRYAAEQGAATVLGVDLSEKMLDVARRTTPQPNVSYERYAMEDFPFPRERFDVVVSSLAIHYVADYGRLCRDVGWCLVPGGAFVFSAEHPIFTAEGRQEWHCAADGSIGHWPVDNYFSEGERTANFLGKSVRKYHRTLTTYINALLESGFEIVSVIEPTPERELLASVEGMMDELRRPMMLLISARKK